MIEPNFNLMMWFVFISWIVTALCRIGLGAAGREKETKYDEVDVIIGIISLILSAIVAFS